MKAALLFVFALFVTPTLAGDCATPKRLTCDELTSRLMERCAKVKSISCDCAVATCYNIPEFKVDYDNPKDCDCNCPEPTTKIVEVGVPGPKVEVPGPTKYIFQDTPSPPAKGAPIFGGGYLYQNASGGTVLGGYQFANGLTLVGGPTYVPQHDTHGSVTGCRSGEPNSLAMWPPICDVKIPFTVDGGHALGGQLLLLYRK